MKKIVVIVFCVFISRVLSGQTAVLINNVQIFDGVSEKLVTGNVLIQGDTVARISSSPYR
ncbi:hypothetical protein [Pseudobacter ginsenosidimutans]|uniref:hypothetical protein n=1 Tax=Pseudobacter ginsenosidimutans TaxID=661488 RepID=UPI001CEF5857|nr:hypothetical protein [Pseudobacter ginsenosidimutans]